MRYTKHEAKEYAKDTMKGIWAHILNFIFFFINIRHPFLHFLVHGRLAGVMGVVVHGGLVQPGSEIEVALPPGPHRPLERV